jgi:F420-non-reducing hydrogenase large subunit
MPLERRTITIDPVTRLEGHAKVDIFLDERGEVERAWLKVPEFRGFEKFCEGRPAEDMPQITSRICGVCPTAHHMAASKALDSLFQVEPPAAAKVIRELVYCAFVTEDHALHLYFLGGPDFIAGPAASKAERNILGVIAKVGIEAGRKVIEMRRKLRGVIALAGGKAIHPVLGLPGGVARGIHADERDEIRQVAAEAVDFGRFTLDTFDALVLRNSEYAGMIRSDTFTHRTYYMGLVDENNRLNFYDGAVRIVSPEGGEYGRFRAEQYGDYIAERVEPETYMKFCFLKPVGWQGCREGDGSGVYCVAPLARLNAADSMATPLAQEARNQYFAALGGPPVHHTLANHWARAVELLYAAERMKELADAPELTDPHIRNLPTAVPREGFGIVEAPRGTLVHHYQSDEKGIIRKANLIVATQNNAARIAMSVEKAAKGLIAGSQVSETVLNEVEMAMRAYDPCFGCATHALAGSMPLLIRVHDRHGAVVRAIGRDAGGRVAAEE